ncbi:MAG: XrtA/PEP-CTERM system TPR-repeat protein PrsT [Ferribacterium limneticum]
MSRQTLNRRQPKQSWRRQSFYFSTRLSAVLVMGLGLSASVLASPEKASSYYEDALKRYEKDEIPAAVIQLKNAIQQDQKMLAAHLLLGKALLRNGDLKGAEAAFEEALKQGVDRGEVALPLGQVYLALGRPEAVIDKISASGLYPALQVEVLTMRGNAYMEAGNASQAKQNWEQARAIDPRSALPLIAEVPMLLAANRLDQAREKAEKAIELAPGSASAWNMKASVHHAALDAKDALTSYDKALSLSPKHLDARIARAALLIDLKRDADARKDLDFLKTFAEDEPRAAYLRAVLAGKKGDAKETNETLKEVTRTVDSLPPAWLTRREQLLMAGALAHYSLGNHQKSREYLDILISRSPNNMGAKKLLASIYLDAKDYGRAQSLLESLQRTLPEDPQVMFLLGSVHLAQKRYAQASGLLEQATARSVSPEMSRSLAFSQLGSGQVEKGISSLEKAFAANPSDTPSGIALASLYMRLGKIDKAKKVASTMIKLDPANLIALNLLASLKVVSGDKAGGRAIYEQVLIKNSMFVPSVLNLARLDAGEKHYDEARRRLNELLKVNSNDHQVLFEFGQLELRAGQSAEAVRFFKKAGEVQRTDPSPTLALINLLLGQRQEDAALVAAKDLAGRFSSSLRVQLALANTYLTIGDRENARTILSAATRLAEYDSRMQVAIARLQLAAGNLEGASYNVYKALQADQNEIAALALGVEVEARRGNMGKADLALKTLTASYPSAIETVRATAQLAMVRGQFLIAIGQYKKVLAREETTANALALVKGYMAAEETKKAIALLEDWVRAHPNDRPAKNALAEVQFRSGNLVAAKHAYQLAIKDSPSNASMLNNYASLLHRLNDPGAQSAAERALSLAPENPAYADTLGWIMVGSGQVELGLRYLREARLRNPLDSEIRFHLAYALAKTGRKNEAKEEFSVAVGKLGVLESLPIVKELKSELGL